MELRNLITSVRNGWASYRARKTTSKAEPVYQWVESEFPIALRPLLPTNSAYQLKGSTGAGNITAAPWVAAFDPTITQSATQGFYLVYLFSEDMKRLYLSIAFGTTQFKSYFPRVQERHAKLAAAAANLSALVTSSRTFVRGPIDLAASSRDSLHGDYEKSSLGNRI